MNEKITLLNKIDDAIKNEGTSSENKKLLKEIREGLIKAETEQEYSNVIIKIIGFFDSLVKFSSTMAKTFWDSD